MKLTSILDKTKQKSSSKVEIKKPYIPLEDRPYDLKSFAQASIISEEEDHKLETNRKQTGNKVETNSKQSDNKLQTLNATKTEKTGLESEEETSKLGTNRKQIENKLVTKGKQTGNKRPTLLNIIQRENDPLAPPPLSELVGLQRNLLLFIYEDCKKNRSKVTSPLTVSHFSSYSHATSGVIKVTLRRLEQKNYIIRKSFKNGRGGWTIYGLSDTVYQDILHFESTYTSEKNIVSTPKNYTFLKTDAPSLIEENQLEGHFNSPDMSLPFEWNEIDIEPLKEIKFTKLHLIQLYKIGILEPKIVQDSIHSFAFDLEHNSKKDKLKLSPLNFFMGILRKGHPYLPPENYESPQDKALRIYIDRKKREEKDRKNHEEEAFQITLKEWIESLEELEIQNICPKPYVDDPESPIRLGYLHKYFKETLWPQKRKEFGL